MNRIHEQKKLLTLLAPQAMTAGGSVTGSYQSIADCNGDALFVVNFGALPQTKTLTVEVYEADDSSGTNAQELTSAQTVFTSPTGGVTEGKVLVSVPVTHFEKEYATVKVSNTKATDLEGQADLIIDSNSHHADLNEDASAVTVV